MEIIYIYDFPGRDHRCEFNGVHLRDEMSDQDVLRYLDGKMRAMGGSRLVEVNVVARKIPVELLKG